MHKLSNKETNKQKTPYTVSPILNATPKSMVCIYFKPKLAKADFTHCLLQYGCSDWMRLYYSSETKMS